MQARRCYIASRMSQRLELLGLFLLLPR